MGDVLVVVVVVVVEAMRVDGPAGLRVVVWRICTLDVTWVEDVCVLLDAPKVEEEVRCDVP